MMSSVEPRAFVFEIEERPHYGKLRAALLDEHAAHRPLPSDASAQLRALMLLRRVQLLIWVLESREHAAFRRGWRAWAREGVSDLAAAVAR
jgi:hypothetical protein